jgi:hypothetical protein
MSTLNDPIKILARRFVSLPIQVRIKVAAKLLRLRDENEEAQEIEKHKVSRRPARNLLEQFWNEVEAAHGDGLYPANPFVAERPQPMLYDFEGSSELNLAHT